MLTSSQIAVFQKKISSWYGRNKRDLPWRYPSLKRTNGKRRDPYPIIISEVMSQQTQIERVIPKYLAWMEKFPTLASLAEAPTQDVLRYWSGLGYNRRALYVQKLAKEVIQNLKGVFPQDEKELRKLPGIGEYTAKALLCFAFDKQIAVIDTNVKKVIAVHFFDGEVPKKKILEKVADELLPKGRAYEWNQALMDYASAELREHKIPIAKQSRFKDSDRYYRGQIVKMLIGEKKIVKTKLYKRFGIQLGPERFEKILTTLQKDGFIFVVEGIVQIC